MPGKFSRTRRALPTNMSPTDLRRIGHDFPEAFRTTRTGAGGASQENKLMSVIRSKLLEMDPQTKQLKLANVADAYIEQMETGSFAHVKEYIDREEGKVPTRLADADGSSLKAYVGMPTEGMDAP